MKTELYIHIPFCVKKCNYCDFLSFKADEETRAQYVESLANQIKEESFAAKARDEDVTISSIYMGGGTPSVLSADEISYIMSKVYEYFCVESDSENTIEVNPKTAEICKLKSIKEAGFNRVSVGMQSADNAELKMLGRIHDFEAFEICYVNIREAGFNNVNIDVMTGLPKQTLDTLMSTTDKVVKLNPEHISAYSLIIEENTPFYETYGQIEGPVVGEELERKMYWECVKYLEEAGYGHYEISNFSKEGFHSRHNCGYWTGVPYIGVGLGASSLFLDTGGDNKPLMSGCRLRNTDNIKDYLYNPMTKVSREDINKEMMMDEFFFLGLRMMQGVDTDEFVKRFSVNPYERYKEAFAALLRDELIAKKGSRVSLTRKGTDYGNYVFSCFII